MYQFFVQTLLSESIGYVALRGTHASFSCDFERNDFNPVGKRRVFGPGLRLAAPASAIDNLAVSSALWH